MERIRHERQLTEFVGSHGLLRSAEHGDLVVSCLWVGSRHRAGHDLSSRRLAQGSRLGQVDFVRAAFLRGATRGLRHRTLHADEGRRVDRTAVDSVASVLGVLRRRLLYRSRAEPGDEDPGASRGEFAGLDVFPFRSADGRPRLGTQSGGPVWSDVDAAGTILQRRRSGAGSQPGRAGTRSAASTSWQRLRDTSSPSPCCFTASSNSCMPITCPPFRWKG